MTQPNDNEFLTMHFDGACEPVNPGGKASGAYIVKHTGLTILSGSKVFYDGGPNATNNVAEYCALGSGLAALHEWLVAGNKPKGVRLLYVKGDSQLVIKQMSGDWSVKAENLKRFNKRCMELAALISCIGISVKFNWIPREQNAECDAMSKSIVPAEPPPF